ncbi:MAG: hypothetical protein NXI00_16720 [Cytophagales bacterium]|nr:hypothetical protein [Cytophagales bacterium]
MAGIIKGEGCLEGVWDDFFNVLHLAAVGILEHFNINQEQTLIDAQSLI